MALILPDKCWFAIYCKSRHERQVNEKLKAKGITTLLAECQTRAQWGPRTRKVSKNLLPGYVLVNAHMDPATYLETLQTPSVVKFVGNPWPRLSWIPDEQVESLLLLLGARVEITEIPYWSTGDRVEVITGPLLGMRGRVIATKKHQHRVAVSIDLLQRSLALEIDSASLRPVPPVVVGLLTVSEES